MSYRSQEGLLLPLARRDFQPSMSRAARRCRHLVFALPSGLFEPLEKRELLSASVPVLAVSGHGMNINYHDFSPRTKDGTDLGLIPTGQTSEDATFILSDRGAAALTLTDPTPVTFSGNAAAAFSVGSLTTNTDGTSTLVVHFAPASVGTSTALVHIASNDAHHPDFTFAVRGTLAFTDYAVTVGTVRVPAGDVITDGGKSFKVPVFVTNPGGLAVRGPAAFADIQIYLHNASTGTDTLVTTLTHKSLSGLGAKGSRKFNVTVTPPLGFSSGTFTFLAVVNANQDIPETNPLTGTPLVNNSDQSDATVSLAQAHVDLSGSLLVTTIPSTQGATDTVFGKLSVTVNNEGNITLPKFQSISLEVRAHNTVTHADTVLLTVDKLSVGKLAPGGSRTFTVTVNDPDGLPAGSYQLEAFITPSPAMVEDSTVNNLITQTVSGQTFTIVSSPASNNLTGALGASTLPTTISHTQKLNGTIQVTVTNSGTSRLHADQQIIIDIFASGLPLTVSPLLNVGNLAAGESRTFTIKLKNVSGLPAGSYTIRAQIDTTPALTETSLDDNIITLDGGGNTIGLTVT